MLSSTSSAYQLRVCSTLTLAAPLTGCGFCGGDGGVLPTHGHVASALNRLTMPVPAYVLNTQSTMSMVLRNGSGTTGYSQQAGVVPVPLYWIVRTCVGSDLQPSSATDTPVWESPITSVPGAATSPR